MISTFFCPKKVVFGGCYALHSRWSLRHAFQITPCCPAGGRGGGWWYRNAIFSVKWRVHTCTRAFHYMPDQRERHSEISPSGCAASDGRSVHGAKRPPAGAREGGQPHGLFCPSSRLDAVRMPERLAAVFRKNKTSLPKTMYGSNYMLMPWESAIARNGSLSYFVGFLKRCSGTLNYVMGSCVTKTRKIPFWAPPIPNRPKEPDNTPFPDSGFQP